MKEKAEAPVKMMVENHQAEAAKVATAQKVMNK